MEISPAVAIADELNGCPRQILGFKTPSEVLAAFVASSG
jgi:IS30 family transposase